MTTKAVEALLQQARDRRELPGPPERRSLREAAGLSLQAVATAVGVTKQAVANWESGEHEPRGPHLAIYGDLLRGLRQQSAIAPPANDLTGATS
jgi:DNA-binding transcriptional regulator YiaG